jgi:hypothetical protein
VSHNEPAISEMAGNPSLESNKRTDTMKNAIYNFKTIVEKLDDRIKGLQSEVQSLQNHKQAAEEAYLFPSQFLQFFQMID